MKPSTSVLAHAALFSARIVTKLIDVPVEGLPVAARCVLIVEDETMIAMMVEDFLKNWDATWWAGPVGRNEPLQWRGTPTLTLPFSM